MAVNTDMKEKTQGFSIKDKTACLIGCGGLGCNIAVHLAGSGIGKLYLCDFDTVSESNLNRQFLYTAKDIGKSKAECAEKWLQEYSPDTFFESHQVKITNPDDASFAFDSDIIICAADNFQGRSASEKLADKLGIPLVLGGIDAFYGMAYLYVPGCSPCLKCAGFDSETRAVHNISSTAGIIGSLQAALATEYLISKDNTLSGKLIIFDGGRSDTLKITPSESCSVCNQKKQIKRGDRYEQLKRLHG